MKPRKQTPSEARRYYRYRVEDADLKLSQGRIDAVEHGRLVADARKALAEQVLA